ncbi:MAG: hypothetical protein JXB06_11105 [Spirochaetales bacterium]|nr:hypothetical protein [Spirochaetales bacterium]
MDSFLQEKQDERLRALLRRETLLQSRVDREDLRYSGLKDLDSLLELIAVRFEIANHLMAHLDPTRSTPEISSATAGVIREKSIAAVNLLEELHSLGISEDQKNIIAEAKGYVEVRDLFQAFILRGGGVFLQTKADDAAKLKKVSRALNEALRKFIAPDDRYAPAFKTEQLPGFLRYLVNFFLPVLAPERQAEPPYGIEEGEQFLLSSQRMTMPLSQAIYYLENEVLPRLERDLNENPGSRVIQHRIVQVQERLREYRSITFRTRATPINLERGFYTDWLSRYTAEGELLVTVPIAVQFGSGTNLDRLREMVQTELVRRLAGRGICPALDRDYRFRKSLESGRRGSSRLPSFKIDARRGFREIKRLYPALNCLEDKNALRKLVSLVSGTGRKRSLKTIEAMMRSESKTYPRLP